MDVQKCYTVRTTFYNTDRLCKRSRSYMQDHPQLNRLIAGVESSDADIMFAIDMAIS